MFQSQPREKLATVTARLSESNFQREDRYDDDEDDDYEGDEYDDEYEDEEEEDESKQEIVDEMEQITVDDKGTHFSFPFEDECNTMLTGVSDKITAFPALEKLRLSGASLMDMKSPMGKIDWSTCDENR